MAIISIANTSSIKVKFYHGEDLNGKPIVKTRTYSSVKPKTSSEDIVTVITAIANLQQHTLTGLNRIDNTSLSQ